ncbi:uncharacterized protein LOC131218180 [Magnolia sinica]|uniref:uncharacterized protein LOC131218177 n=1 Tax=Magnolia sinica TaxID=86752 RepID=UPI002659075E|nr:uncharacterized protein LOC131218177 [Magnolia sinica]XP_058068843.1 uncharacterized protein LOC131218180 [Magnolia sinica]
MEEDEWHQVRPKGTRYQLHNLFAENITYDITAEYLYRIFGRYGKITDTFIPTNPGLNRSRGYGFIRFVYKADAQPALDILNGKRVNGRIIIVQKAKVRSQPAPFTHQGARGSTLAPASRVFPPRTVTSYVLVVRGQDLSSQSNVRRNATTTDPHPAGPILNPTGKELAKMPYPNQASWRISSPASVEKVLDHLPRPAG